jgi:hypothetical protein
MKVAPGKKDQDKEGNQKGRAVRQTLRKQETTTTEAADTPPKPEEGTEQ